ncbi:MAG: hypothetical protein M3463_17330, partial [Verrucomicrobiota bacterium]|nr:hypothetical protein [Verrucomicrobiota bacterium]
MTGMRPHALPVVALMAVGVLGAAEPAAPSVPGYELLRQRGGEAQAEAGQVLLSELACLACHGDRTRLTAGALSWKSGPDLNSAGSRLRADYVRRFLLDPAQTKPGTTMPNLLAGRAAAERSELAEILTHYLMQLRVPHEEPPALAASAEKGRDLFHEIGCV